MTTSTRYTGLIDKYRDRLPVAKETKAVSLCEGNTPLIQLINIPAIIKKNVDIYVKGTPRPLLQLMQLERASRALS